MSQLFLSRVPIANSNPQLPISSSSLMSLVGPTSAGVGAIGSPTAAGPPGGVFGSSGILTRGSDRQLAEPTALVGLENAAYRSRSNVRLTDDYELEQLPITDGRYNVAQDLEDIRAFQSAQDERRVEASRALEGWNWGLTAWNVIACLLCPGCLWCMVGALLCNVFAYVDHKSHDYERKRFKLGCAVGWSIAAFIGGIVTVIVVVVVLFVAYDAKDWNSIPTIPGSDYFM